MADDDFSGLEDDIQELSCAGTYQLDEAIICLDVSRDSSRVAAGTIDDPIVVLDRDLKLQRKLDGHEGGTNSLAFAAGDALVSAGEDGKAKIWDTKTGSCVELACEGVDADKTPDGHTVTNVAINPAGTLALCSAGKTVHLLDVAAEDKEAARKQYPPVTSGVVEDARFVRDNKLLVSYYGGITLWSTEPSEDGVALEYGTAVHCVAGTPEIKWLVGGCMDSCVHIWHVKQVLQDDGEGEGYHLEELSCGGYSHKVTAVDFDRSNRYLASAGGRSNTIWDFSGTGPANSTPTLTMGHIKPITAQCWQRDGAGLLATGAKDGRVAVYNVREVAGGFEGMPNICLPAAMGEAGAEAAVTCLRWGDGGRLYSGHEDGSVRCWVLPEGLGVGEETAAESHLLESAKSPA